MTEPAYEAYGRQLATHLPGAGFIWLDDLDKPDELIAAARILTPAPLLVWEAPFEDWEARRDSYTRLLQGNVVVLYKTDGSQAQRRQAFADARLALLTLFDQMRQDEGDPLSALAGAQVRIENDRVRPSKVGPVGAAWWGMGAEFTWRLPLESQI